MQIFISSAIKIHVVPMTIPRSIEKNIHRVSKSEHHAHSLTHIYQKRDVDENNRAGLIIKLRPNHLAWL